MTATGEEPAAKQPAVEKLKGAIKEVKATGSAVRAMAKAANVDPAPMPEPIKEAKGPAVASQCKVSGVGLELAIARQTASFTIEACDEEGTPLRKGGTPFFAAVRGSSLVKARLTDNGDGTHLCEYRPSVSGNFSIAVSLNGAPLPGSPFALQVLQPRPDAPQCLLRGDGLNGGGRPRADRVLRRIRGQARAGDARGGPRRLGREAR